MPRFVCLLLLTVVLVMAAQGSSPRTASPQNPAVTFNKDVLPILQKNCQTCHRPGQVAPMSFLTYESTRPWAKAIKVQVTSKQMPPWTAEQQYGHFAKERSVKQSAIDTIAAWVVQAAQERPRGD